MAEGRYAKVYDQLADEFPAIYDDDEALAAYVRLLKIAGNAWPQAGALPRAVSDATVEKLRKSTLVKLLPGDRFRIRGLDKEREKRSAAGRAGAYARHGNRNADRNADRNAIGLLAEQSRADTEKASQGRNGTFARKTATPRGADE